MSGTSFALNTSISKQKFSFGKGSRFAPVKQANNLGAYDAKDEWSKLKDENRNKMFTT